MIKFVMYVTLCVCLIFWHFAHLQNPALEVLGAGEFRIYSRQKVESHLISRRIDIALGHVFITASYNANALRAKFTHIDGESITLNWRIPARYILNKLGYHKIESQTIHRMHITYAYSARGRDFITSGSDRINLQIVERANSTTIGWPILLGGY